MREIIKSTVKNLKFNFKTLLTFELVYLVLGLILVFPLIQLLFYLSIQFSGYQYITNMRLISYLLLPQTIAVFLVIATLISIYIVIEMVFLALLFDYGHHEEKIDVRSLLYIGLRRVVQTLKRHHIKIIGPAFLFIFVVEVFHVAGFASTFSVPRYIIEELQSLLALQIIIYAFIIFSMVMFIETVFSINIYTFEKISFKDAYKKTRAMLKGQRLKLSLNFIVLNIGLNLVLYAFSALILALLGGIIYISRGQDVALGFFLSVLYTVYFVITTISTMILIPINYALISSWYYKQRDRLGYERKNMHFLIPKQFIKPPKWFKRIVYLGLIAVVAVNIANTLTVLGQSRSPAELFSRPQVIAHRGATLHAPENTIEAMEIAINQGADAVEFDVQVSSDGVPYLMHDATLGRTTNDPLNRSSTALGMEIIQALDAGSWFSEEYAGVVAPTLQEIFDAIGGRADMFIDLKASSPEFNASVVELIEAYDLIDDVKVMSFDVNQLNSIKALNEDIETVLLVASFIGNFSALIDSDAIDNVAFRAFLLRNNPSFVRQTHNANKNAYVWTIETREDSNHFVEMGVDGLISKDPIIGREAVYGRNTNPALIDWLRELFTPE